MIIFAEVNRNNYNKIIDLIIKYTNFILYYDYYYYYEYKKLKYSFIRYYYHFSKLYSIEYYNYSCKLHRVDGPDWIEYCNNGGIEYRTHYINGKEYSYEDYLLEIKKLVQRIYV